MTVVPALLALSTAFAGTSGVRFRVANDASLHVEAAWEAMRDTRHRLPDRHKKLGAAINSGPVVESREFDAVDWRGWLPRKPVEVGDLWPLKGEAVLPFLRMFHPGATLNMHHAIGTGGAYAMLRGATSEEAEVAFRIHADFKIAPGTWLTPAQFTGFLRWDLVANGPLAFHLYLPRRNTNADVNSEGKADIGFIPRMELAGGDLETAPEWESALDAAEAAGRLAAQFYLFTEIDWLPLPEAVSKTIETRKPLHVIVLFGTLDDESC